MKINNNLRIFELLEVASTALLCLRGITLSDLFRNLPPLLETKMDAFRNVDPAEEGQLVLIQKLPPPVALPGETQVNALRNIDFIAKRRFTPPQSPPIIHQYDSNLEPFLTFHPSIKQEESKQIERWVNNSQEAEKTARIEVAKRILRCLETKNPSLDLGGLAIQSLPDLGFLSHITHLDLSCTLISSLREAVLPPNLKRINLIATSVASLEGIPNHVDIIPNQALFEMVRFPGDLPRNI